MTQSDFHPDQLVREVGRRWPKAWQQYKLFRTDRAELGGWPDWCYVPMAAAYAIVSSGSMELNASQSLLAGEWTSAVAAAAAWRLSKGIYRFDPDVYRSLLDQPFDGKLPSEVLFKLPEWGVYIETPGMSSHGFFVHLEYDVKTHIPELRLLVMMRAGYHTPIPILLGDWDLQTAMDKLAASAHDGLIRLREQGAPIPTGIENLRIPALEVVPYLQLVLYLCSANAEIAAQRSRRRTKGRPGKLDVPPECRQWDVGLRIGASIRTYRNQQAVELLGKEPESDETRVSRSPRPHMRRAHWHSYWTGPRDGERKVILHWLPPLPVNMMNVDSLPAVVREVIEDGSDEYDE